MGKEHGSKNRPNGAGEKGAAYTDNGSVRDSPSFTTHTGGKAWRLVGEERATWGQGNFIHGESSACLGINSLWPFYLRRSMECQLQMQQISEAYVTCLNVITIVLCSILYYGHFFMQALVPQPAAMHPWMILWPFLYTSTWNPLLNYKLKAILCHSQSMPFF